MSDHSDIHSSSFPYESEQKKTRGQRLVFWLLVAGLSTIFLTLLARVVYHWISNEFTSITVPFIFYGSTLIRRPIKPPSTSLSAVTRAKDAPRNSGPATIYIEDKVKMVPLWTRCY